MLLFFVMLLGIGVLALPIAILSTGFAQEVSRRDFVVTWTLMSRIPLFTELDAAQAAEFIHYLSAHNYPARWEVIHEGGPADGMFFIASGRVRVQTQAGESELGTGDFFGEVEMLRRSTHQYRYTTATNCRLLKMSRDDFDRLAATNPVIGAHVRAIAAARTAARDAGQPEPRGNFSPAVPGVPLRS